MSRLIPLTQGLLLTATLIAGSATGAELYYKWEKDGVTQYTKEKPRDVPSQEVRTMGGKAPGSSSASAAPTPAAAPEHTDTASKAPAGKKDPEMCKRAKANLETLESTAIVRMKDEYGKEVVMDDKQRDEQIKRAQEAIKANC